MNKSNNQKIKLVLLYDYLKKESDYNNPKTTADVIKYLKDKGISCDRRTLYDDIKALNDAGFKIETEQHGNSNAYYAAFRDFENAELRILMDAVQAAACIDKDKTEKLIKTIASQAGEHNALNFAGSKTTFNTRKHSNKYIFGNIEIIERAIRKRRLVSFPYYSHLYNGDKKYHSDKTVLPLHLVFNNDNYYLRAFDTANEDVRTYRIDRMERVEDKGTPNLSSNSKALIKQERIKITRFTSEVFNMFEGKTRCNATLKFDEAIVDSIFDQFGENTKISRTTDGKCCTTVQVSNSGTFFGWVFQFGDAMTIVSPSSLRDEYMNKLNDMAEKYKRENYETIFRNNFGNIPVI